MVRFAVALALALAAALTLVSAPAASAAPRWLDGVLKTEIQNVNCVSQIVGSPYLEAEIGASVGQYVDDASPVVGEVFDVHLVVGTIGNECAGTRPKLEIALPPGVTPAVGGPHTIRCWLRSSGSQPFGPVSAAEGCPTTVRPGTTNHPSISNWISLDPNPGSPAAPAWPLPQGAQLEIQVPVVADRVMNGIGDTTGCVCVVASVQTINGISRPDNAFTWASGMPSTGAYQHLFVFAAPPGGGAPGGGTLPSAPPAGPTGGATGAPGAAAQGPGAAAPARPKVRLPTRASRAALRGGRVRAKLTGLQRGDRVRVRVMRGRTTLAQGRATARGARLSVRLQAARSATVRRQLRRRGAVKVVVSVTRRGRSVPVAGATLRLT